MPTVNDFNVLIVGDGIERARKIAKQFKSISTDFNLEINIASTAFDVIKMIDDKKYDAVIFDLHLGQQDEIEIKSGLERLKIVKRLRERNSNTKFVACASYVEESTYIPFRNQIKSADFAVINPKTDDLFREGFSKIFQDFISKKDTVEKKPNSKLIIPVQTSISVVNKRLTDIFRQNPELLRNLDPIQFEHLVAELFEDQGYKAVLTPPRSDGGKDIYVYKSDPILKTSFLVECKRYVPPNKVGVDIARQLYGVVEQEDVSGGIIVTTSYFTRDAQEFANTVPYHLFLRDFDDLKIWLKEALGMGQNPYT